jgi:hypothetical protein
MKNKIDQLIQNMMKNIKFETDQIKNFNCSFQNKILNYFYQIKTRMSILTLIQV